MSGCWESRFAGGDHRIGADIAEVGFLIADKIALTFEIDIRVAADIAILCGDDALHGIGDLLHECAFGASGKGGGGEIDLRHIPSCGHSGGSRGVGSIHGGVGKQIGDDQKAVRIEIGNQAAEVGELVVGVHHDRWLAIGTIGVDRVIGRKVRPMASKGYSNIVGIAKAGVGTSC